MRVKSTFNNKKIYSKGARSMKKIKPSNRFNLSIMDEKLSLLNSDIEELYKKYVEKKKLRRRKEKSEQSLASRINFLIDEERKIRTQIENKIIKNHHCSKNRSVKILRAPEIMTNSGTIRYNTIESSDNSPRNGKFRIYNFKNGNKKKYINNIENDQLTEMIKRNGLNDLTLSSIQNNSSIENNNITIGNRSNVTNNVCIIINNPDKNITQEESNNKYINCQDISFAEKESNSNYNEDSNKNKCFNINEVNSEEKENNNINNLNNYINIKEDEIDEKKININNEINYIKMRLASKLNEEQMQTISQTYQHNNEITLKNKINNIYINEMTEKKNNFKEFYPEKFENNLNFNLNTPSFKKNINTQKEKKRNRSLKSILDSKRKKLKSLENEIKEKQNKFKEEKNKLDNKKKKNLIIKININNKYDKKIDKRCFSKPDNRINTKNKIYKTFNRNNIKNSVITNVNKSQIINQANPLNSRNNKGDENDYKNLSIDSGEIILSDTPENISNPKNKKKESEKNISKPLGSIFNKKNKIIKKNRNREQSEDENIYYECESTPNLLNNANLTFNQSIEKKRQLLGIPLNVRENLNTKMEEIAKNIKNENKYENKNTHNTKNNEEKINKLYNRNNENDKSTKTIYDKRNINKNKNIIIKPKNKKDNNLNSLNSPYKENNYEIESYSNSNYNNYNTNIKLFNNNNFNKNILSIKEKNNNIPNTSSLTSLFSTQTNKTYKPNNNLFKNKNIDYDSINKSNISNITKSKKNKNIHHTTKSNCNIIIKKNENKNYLNTIRLIKKRDKNNIKDNQNQNQINNEKKEIKNINNNNNKIEDKSKIYENKIKPRKELAVIRRINMKIEDYKKNGPQVYQISKKHKIKNEGNNINNNFKGKEHYNSFRRLSEIKKRPNSSFSHKNVGVSKSKSNKSLPKCYKKIKSFNL